MQVPTSEWYSSIRILLNYSFEPRAAIFIHSGSLYSFVCQQEKKVKFLVCALIKNEKLTELEIYIYYFSMYYKQVITDFMVFLTDYIYNLIFHSKLACKIPLE